MHRSASLRLAGSGRSQAGGLRYRSALGCPVQRLAVMRLVQIECWADRHNAGWIYFRVCHVVVPFDMVEVDCLGNACLLIQVAQITIQVWIVDYSPEIALKMEVINRVEANQGTK